MSNFIKGQIYWAIIMSSVFFSCKKETNSEAPIIETNLELNVSHHCDGAPLAFDTIIYKNEAGSSYSITRLEYYISGIRFYENNELKFQSSQINYVNGRENSNTISINHLPVGNYSQIDFLIGIAPLQNLSNSLDNTPENINMQWPEVIGGGYHFLKFEGRYIDTANAKIGFTMHIGTNEMLIAHQKLSKNFSIQEKVPVSINLSMNVNEWFKNPYTYDFNKDGNYTMAIPELMTLLKNNGYDTFKIKE